MKLAELTPAFAAPILCEDTGKGSILHLAPLADGVAQDEDIGRALPHNLQICLELVCLLQLLEEKGGSFRKVLDAHAAVAAVRFTPL